MTLLILSLVFIVSRLFLYFSLKEELIIEGLYIGTLAKDIMESQMVMSFWDYQFSSYDGGVLVSAVFLIPFFILFGQINLSFVLASITNNIIILVVWWFFLQRNFGRTVALLFGLLYVICPFLYFRWGIVLGGNHAQVTFFYGAFLLLFYELWYNPGMADRPRLRNLYIFLLGILSGFGTWFCYSLLVLFVPVGMFWFIHSRKVGFKSMLTFLTGCLIGYSPFFLRIREFGGLVAEEIFGELIVGDVINRFIWKFKGIFNINTSGETVLYINLYWLLCIASLAGLLIIHRHYFAQIAKSLLKPFPAQGREGSKALILIVFPVIFFLVYLISNFNILYGDTYSQHYRYFMPPAPFLFACIAIFVSSFLKSSTILRRRIGVGLLIFCLFLGIRDCILNISIKDFPNTKYAKSRGYSYEMLGTVFCWRFEKNPIRALELLDSVRSEYRGDAYRGFGYELALLEDGNSYRKIIADSQLRHQFQLGFILGEGSKLMDGTQLGESYPSIIQDASRAKQLDYFFRMTALIHRFDTKFKSDCFKGLGIQFNVVSDDADAVPPSLRSAIGAEYWSDFVAGLDSYRSFQKI